MNLINLYLFILICESRILRDYTRRSIKIRYDIVLSQLKNWEIINIIICIIIMMIILWLLNYYTFDDHTFYSYYSVFLPLKFYNDLSSIDKYKFDLYKKGGVYGIINISGNSKQNQYIGSSLNLWNRLRDHVRGRRSNSQLQRNISKYGINNFIFVIYYWHKDITVTLTDIETNVINSFPFEDLFNFKTTATSLLGYKHSKKAIEKMSLAKIKFPVNLFDTNYVFIKRFISQTEMAKYLNLHKTTINKCLKSGKLISKKYYVCKADNNLL